MPDQAAKPVDEEEVRRSRPLLDRVVELARVQYALVVRSIQSTCGVDEDTAKDLFQDVCVNIAKNGINAEPESVLGYLCVAARNRHIDLVRREARAAANAAANRETPRYLLGDEDRTVNDVALRMMMLHAFDDLDAIPRRERSAVVLRHLFDFTPSEIADELHITPKQVDNLLQQARKRFASNQAAREANPSYAILAVILRPVRDNATALACPAGFSALAASVAFSVLAATATGGGVPASSAWSPVFAKTHITASATSKQSSVQAGSGPLTVRRFVGDRLPVRGPERSSRSLVMPTVTVPAACTDQVCVGTGPNGMDRPGDTVTVTVAGREFHASESVMPVCEYVPATGATECRRQEPAAWIVKDIPPTPYSGGPS